MHESYVFTWGPGSDWYKLFLWIAWELACHWYKHCHCFPWGCTVISVNTVAHLPEDCAVCCKQGHPFAWGPGIYRRARLWLVQTQSFIWMKIKQWLLHTRPSFAWGSGYDLCKKGPSFDWGLGFLMQTCSFICMRAVCFPVGWSVISARMVTHFHKEQAVFGAIVVPHLHECQPVIVANTVPLLNEGWALICAFMVPHLHESWAFAWSPGCDWWQQNPSFARGLFYDSCKQVPHLQEWTDISMKAGLWLV